MSKLLDALKNWKVLVGLAVVVVVGAVAVSRLQSHPEELRLDEFNDRLADDQVRTATINNSLPGRA